MCGLSGPVVWKGSNFDPVLCDLSPPAFGGGPAGASCTPCEPYSVLSRSWYSSTCDLHEARVTGIHGILYRKTAEPNDKSARTAL